MSYNSHLYGVASCILSILKDYIRISKNLWMGFMSFELISMNMRGFSMENVITLSTYFFHYKKNLHTHKQTKKVIKRKKKNQEGEWNFSTIKKVNGIFSTSKLQQMRSKVCVPKKTKMRSRVELEVSIWGWLNSVTFVQIMYLYWEAYLSI